MALGDLNLASYDGALAGVEPGDPAGSTLVTLQAEGGHAGQFSDDELEKVRQWIADGALDAPTSEPEPEPEPEAELGTTWQDVVGLFQEKCVSCHGEAMALGDLNLASYDGALEGVEPGNPAGSTLVTLQAEGGHAGQFSDDELERVQQWIADGAQEE
jgi:mono/diheme cytochrome c family protein